MKNIILTSGFIMLCFSSFAQRVIVESNGKVTVRNANDSIITQIDSIGSGAINASFNAAKSEIIVIYNDGNVLVKKADGTIIAEVMGPSSDKAVVAVWSDDNVVITTQSNQTLTKNSLEWKRE